MQKFSLDYETTSACDLVRCGAYRYSADPSTRILMFAIAKEDGPPLLWRFDEPESFESEAAKALLSEAVETKGILTAFNAPFELAISTYRMKPDLGLDPPDIRQWRCTQAMCRRAAAPESLAKAAEFFGLGDQKDPIGKALIGVFSDQTKVKTLMPPPGMKDPTTIEQRKDGTFTQGRKPANRKTLSPILEKPVPWEWLVKVDGNLMSVRDAWEAFCGYCKQDVRTERELHRKLKHFELKGDVLESFQFSLAMNHRGVPVNVDALRNAQKIVAELAAKLGRRSSGTTGLKHTQRAKVLAWLQERGYEADNLQAATVEEVLSDPPAGMKPLTVEMLRAYSLVQFAALAKIGSMEAMACDDGHVRGTMTWHGARTGRASGAGIQPQNFRRPTIDDTDLCYRMIREGWESRWFENLWESPLEALASSIRHFIQPHEGWAISCDFAAIEGRLAAWMTGDKRTLQMMLDGIDIYKDLGSKIFGVPSDQITKDQRQAAKGTWLACIYGAGGRTLRRAFKDVFRIDKTLEECKHYAEVYRETHPEIVDSWASLDGSAKLAIRAPGSAFAALDGRVTFKSGSVAGINYLTLRLPSGRRLYYPHPTVKWEWVKYTGEEMEEEPWKREKGGYRSERVSYYGRRQGYADWGRVTMFPAKWLENLIQAMGADFLDHGCLECERNGVDIRMVVHDEIFALKNGHDVESVTRMFTKRPEWALDFALEAEGEEVAYYRK
jgi:DNA polymerase bacteriophage-type